MPVAARRLRVYAYVTSRDRLLVFEHADYPEAGIQVPAGTVLPGEAPSDAVLREAEEETGLTGLEIVRHLGTLERDMSGYGAPEIQEAWFFHLRCPGEPAETWRHAETSGGTVEPIWFEFYWASLPHPLPELIALNGAMLAELIRGGIGVPGTDSEV